MTSPTLRRMFRLPRLWLALASISLFCGALYWTASPASFRMTGPPSYSEVPIREAPLHIQPEGLPNLHLPETDIQRLLLLAKPRWKILKPSFLIHALLFWGAKAELQPSPFDEGIPIDSSERILEVLTDSGKARVHNIVPYPILSRSRYGVCVLVAGGGAIAHDDQYLKVMAEAGVPSDTCIVLPDGSKSTLKSIIRDSLANFHAKQEIEFSAAAYARWLPPLRAWVDRRGEAHSFDEIVRILVARDLTKTSCSGAHTMYALASIIRAHRMTPILDEDTVAIAEGYVRKISRLLELHQSSSGAWLKDWVRSSEPAPKTPLGYQTILVTGHHLEWIALAPDDLRPRRECVESAARVLAATLKLQDAQTAGNSYPEFSHALRAVFMYLGENPAIASQMRAGTQF